MNQEPPGSLTKRADACRAASRAEVIQRAAGVLALAGRPMTNRELAKTINMDPRGLLNIIRQYPQFLIVAVYNKEEGRFQPSYSLKEMAKA